VVDIKNDDINARKKKKKTQRFLMLNNAERLGCRDDLDCGGSLTTTVAPSRP
jgi:hypothetical protein